jgi:hypothetical protein
MRGILITATTLVLFAAPSAHAQLPGYPAWQEQFRDGACVIKRKQERSGAYREEIRCDGFPRDIAAPILNEEYFEGHCKVVRRQESNGASFFERNCKALD